MKRFALFLIAACAFSAWAGGMESLEAFIRNAKSGRAEFTQLVTAPAKQGAAPKTKTSSGSFEFSRPNRFRFHYKKPFEQTIVADGQTLWLYDLDLNQVTARAQAQALGTTPAALIASAPDLASLQRDFTLLAAPDKDGLEWVQAIPKAKEGSLQSVRVGFKAGTLAVLEIQDTFGQQSRLSFSGFTSNVALDNSVFQFKPPASADVIRQ